MSDGRLTVTAEYVAEGAVNGVPGAVDEVAEVATKIAAA